MAERIEVNNTIIVIPDENVQEEDSSMSMSKIARNLQDYLGVWIFMIGVACRTNGRSLMDASTTRYLGSIYYRRNADINGSIGSLDVYEIMTGNGKVVLPGCLQDQTPDFEGIIDATTEVPSTFRLVRNRESYIDTKDFDSTFQQAVQREYQQPEDTEDDDSQDTEVEENDESQDSCMNRHHTQFKRLSMSEICNMTSMRHDPCSPNMKTIEQRLRTFQGWRLTGRHDAYHMAKAGFFFTGPGNQAECYYCGLRMYDWIEDPIIEHVQWVPRCRFLRDTYSLDFIYGILFNRKDFLFDGCF